MEQFQLFFVKRDVPVLSCFSLEMGELLVLSLLVLNFQLLVCHANHSIYLLVWPSLWQWSKFGISLLCFLELSGSLSSFNYKCSCFDIVEWIMSSYYDFPVALFTPNFSKHLMNVRNWFGKILPCTSSKFSVSLTRNLYNFFCSTSFLW